MEAWKGHAEIYLSLGLRHTNAWPRDS